MAQRLDELNDQFSIPGLQFEHGKGGLLRAKVDGEQATGEVYLQGAHVTKFVPRGQAPVLWMSQASMFSSNKPIRGGVPLCFPWFGPHPQQLPDAPAHGTARITPWNVARTQVDATGGIQIALQTHINAFELLYEATFGNTLKLALTVRLPDDATPPTSFEQALHTYLNISDIRNCSIRGLESASYIDKLDGAQVKPPSGTPIMINSECDRVYIQTTARCELRDQGLERTLYIDKVNSMNTVVWNPWIAKSARMPDFGNDEWQEMVCIESANVGEHLVTLLPGESHCLAAIIGIKI